MIKGRLKIGSPLPEIFPAGLVPLASTDTTLAVLGAEPGLQEVYMLSLRLCTPEQLEELAQRMSARGQGPLEEARQHLATASELPLRAFHFSTIEIPLAAFI